MALAQRRLHHLGYAPEQDGGYGQQTADAVRAFQTQQALPATEVLDGASWCALLTSAARRADGLTERASLAERYRPVQLELTAELPQPLLVSVRDRNQRWQIALALPERERLYYLDTGGDAFDPAWQPGRRWLAFTSVRGAEAREAIWLLDTISGQVRQISTSGLSSRYPTWSPDGQFLLFTSEELSTGGRQVRNYRYLLATGQLEPWGTAPAGWADWSATDVVVFVHNPKHAPDDRQIYVMQADGSDVQAVTAMPGPASNPIWLDRTTLVFAHQTSPKVRQPYLLRLPADLRPLSLSEERIWFMQRVP